MRSAPLLGLTTAISAAGMAYAVRGKSSQVFGPSVWHGPADRPAIALTFDDGPSESTPELLRVLAANDAPATFFQCGGNVRRLAPIAREVRAAGHEIGNHSDTHPYFSFCSPAFIEDDFRRAQQTIEDTLSVSPEYMRAPYGIRWPGFRAMQSQLNLTGVMWTVIARDWKLSASNIVRRVLARAANGAIVCLHDGRALNANPDISATIAAVSQLIPELRAQGYRFVTIPQLLCPIN